MIMVKEKMKHESEMAQLKAEHNKSQDQSGLRVRLNAEHLKQRSGPTLLILDPISLTSLMCVMELEAIPEP